MKEEPIWNVILVDKYICPILYNQINLGYNVLYNLLDYGNKCIGKNSNKEVMCLSSTLFYAYIDKIVQFRKEFYLSGVNKWFNSPYYLRRRCMTSITNVADEINDKKIVIDELTKIGCPSLCTKLAW